MGVRAGFVLLSHLAGLALLATIGAPAARAGGKDLGNFVTDTLTKRTCGTCHMAYAPIALPARSWAALMERTDDHFGVHLLIGARTRHYVRAYLMSKSADGGGTHWGKLLMAELPAGAVPLRITTTPRFVRHHENAHFRAMVIDKKTSPARCLACHKEAELCVLGEFPR